MGSQLNYWEGFEGYFTWESVSSFMNRTMEIGYFWNRIDISNKHYELNGMVTFLGCCAYNLGIKLKDLFCLQKIG